MKKALTTAASASVLAIYTASALVRNAGAQTAPTAPTDMQTQGKSQPAKASANTAQAPAAAIEQVVVTGSTSKRTILNASVAVTNVSQQQLQEKAPRGTDDILEQIPGIFVQATAGPVSNNYSVRGLPGGSQEFVRLEEDGMPAIYGGLNDDEVFQYDLSIGRVEGLEGGTSGILAINAAGASINFISRPLNFETQSGVFRALGSSYGEGRGDFWYSAPLGAPGKGLAFSLSGFYDNTPGVRDSAFRYQTVHLKAQIEKRFDNDGFVRVTYKHWDEHDPYYADQPYAFNNGQIGGVPGLDTQFGNIIGRDFGSIVVPDSCTAGECTRLFDEKNGIHATGDEYRIDVSKPIIDGLTAFARVRYTQTNWDFNGVFAGSGTGNGGLQSAVGYLNPVTSPISSLLLSGLTAFPGTTQFGIRDVSTGRIIPASNVAALNALNGNGLLEQTVLNHQLIKINDWGSDFGLKWDSAGAAWTNSLTVGGMIYSQHLGNDQSGVAPVINDVRDGSNIYDIVALNNTGGVLGQLTNNGLISYGDWGQGLSHDSQDSESVYFNDELTLLKKLHLDVGLRYEHESEEVYDGNASPAPVPAGTPGIIATNPNAFNGTYSVTKGQEHPLNWTVGLNYVLLPDLSVYGRYADSYQTQGANPQATELILYEAGVTFSKYNLFGTVRGFRTEFNNTSFGGGVDPSNPNLSQGFFANLIANGADIDLTYKPPVDVLPISLHVQGTYQTSVFNNVTTGSISAGGVNIAQQVQAFYNGKTAAITPSWLFTFQPTYYLPDSRGELYARYKYIGSVFADNGNALALPAYGILTFGGIYDVTPRIEVNVSVDNVTNELGLTEGNPRQGFTQSIVNGYFYGRGIIGTNAQFSMTYKF